VRVVASLDDAIAHIAKYASQHTDAIVTQDHGNAMRFLREVDSSSVLVNASTRFADGFEYGLGAEIGISTNKLHARPLASRAHQPEVDRPRFRPDPHVVALGAPRTPAPNASAARPPALSPPCACAARQAT
jgi:hypothetical protein